jgi:hypothetical protein
MCTVLLPPAVNPAAVNKYVNAVPNFYNTETYIQESSTCKNKFTTYDKVATKL